MINYKRAPSSCERKTEYYHGTFLPRCRLEISLSYAESQAITQKTQMLSFMQRTKVPVLGAHLRSWFSICFESVSFGEIFWQGETLTAAIARFKN